MLKSCSFESQIRRKASQTFTEMVTEWCDTAKAALRATEQQKQKRLKPSERLKPSVVVDGDENADAVERHRQNFEELDKWIRNGDLDLDLEWCSVEVVHSSEVGKRSELKSESTQVLVFPNKKGASERNAEGRAAASCVGNSVAVSIAAVDGSARVVQRWGNRRRKFLRRIGSKVKVQRSREKSR
ncbi:hypothetical protein ACHAXS_003862 [Conticribra weissflogii]